MTTRVTIRRVRAFAASAYAVGIGLVLLGFLLPADNVPARFTWRSSAYIVQVAVLALGLVVPLLWLLPIRSRAIQACRLGGVAVLGLGVTLYLIVATHYYATQERRFDPFLQVRPAEATARLADAPRGMAAIAALGGSTTRGFEIADADRYPALLEQELRTTTGIAVVVANAGADWWTTKHSLIDYVVRVSHDNPDIVIVLHAINDLYRSFSPPDLAIGGYRADWAHFYGPAIRAARPPAYWKHLLQTYAPVLPARWYARFRYVERDYALEDFRSLPAFETHLRQLVRISRWSGAHPVLVTQPSLYHEHMTDEARAATWFAWVFCNRRVGLFRREYPSNRSMQRALAAYNATVRRVADEENVTFVDAAAAVPPILEYFKDDVHFTPAGSLLVARTIAAALAPLVQRGE